MKSNLLNGGIALGLIGAVMSPGYAQLTPHPVSGRIGSGPADFEAFITGSLSTGAHGVSIASDQVTFTSHQDVNSFNVLNDFSDLYIVNSPTNSYDIPANTTVNFDKNKPLFTVDVNNVNIPNPHTIIDGTITFFDANQINLGTLPFEITNFDPTNSTPEPGSVALGVSLLVMSGGALLKRRQRRN